MDDFCTFLTSLDAALPRRTIDMNTSESEEAVRHIYLNGVISNLVTLFRQTSRVPSLGSKSTDPNSTLSGREPGISANSSTTVDLGQ